MPDEDSKDHCLTDADLLEQSRHGDHAAFATLVQRHHTAILRFARMLTRTPEQAEDVLQQTFLAVWRTVVAPSEAAKRGDAPVRAWLYAIARNAAYRTARRRSGEPEQHEPLETLAVRAGWGTSTDPERTAMLVEDGERVRAALVTLSDDDRAIIMMRDVEELSGDEVAQALSLPLATMKTRLHRARLRLRAALQREVEHAG